MSLSTSAFRPPAPVPRTARLDLFSLLPILRDNPLEAWQEAHFTQFFVRSRLPFLPALVVSEPRAVRHVLLDNAANYRKDDLLLRILSSALAHGLLTVDGDQWRRQRRAVAPMFAPKMIQSFAPTMIEAAEALTARWSKLEDGACVNVADELTNLTLEILQRTIFSDGIGPDVDRFRLAMRTYFDTIGKIDLFDILRLPDFIPRPTHWPVRKALRSFDSAVDAIVRKRRKLLAEGLDEAPIDILTLLLTASDPNTRTALSEAELRANIITFMAAGHETTANALTWSLFLLSHDEKWRARAAAEAKRFRIGEGDPCAGLDVIRAVVEEALRLYPPIAAISRVAIKDDEVCGEPVKRGTMVIVAPYVLQRHRKLWADPDVFDPSRFLAGAREAIPRFAYLPFGGGPRTCVGAGFALQEAMLVLATILKEFELTVAEGTIVQPLLRITLRPRDGLPMRVGRVR